MISLISGRTKVPTASFTFYMDTVQYKNLIVKDQ